MLVYCNICPGASFDIWILLVIILALYPFYFGRFLINVDQRPYPIFNRANEICIGAIKRAQRAIKASEAQHNK